MNSKRTHLSLEIKHFIVLEKKRRPKISQTELVWEVNRKFGVSTSRRAIRLTRKTSSRLLWLMPQKRGKNERELSRRSGLILNQTDENLLKDHPEYQTCLGLVKFGESRKGGKKQV